VAEIRCGSCKETFEIESIEYSANYDCTHCGKKNKFTTELDRWVKKVYCKEINPDFVLLKKTVSDRLDGIIMGLCLVIFGGGMLIAWMFIVTIPIGLFCVKAGIQLLFDETSKEETFSVFDKSKSRIVYFEYTNGELTHSLETKLKIDSRCKIIGYSWSYGLGEDRSTLEKVFITQKDGAIDISTVKGRGGRAFAQYLEISYENKGWFENGIPIEASEWTKW
tara:strand:- start:91 stop:756 length:666 start_codon:yes stop_codon:yes gene_type:complete